MQNQIIALTRAVSPTLGQCELTHIARAPIDVALAQTQHAGYERALRDLGCDVRRLPAAPQRPDAVFVEDTALVLDEIAVITRPGAASRRPETTSVAEALAAYRPLAHIEPPGTLDGGDILQVSRHIFVGQSQRSNDNAVRQLQNLVAPFGYTVTGIPIHGCLHLKSAVTQIAADTLLINRAWVDAEIFTPWHLIDIDPTEPYAANALWISNSANATIYPTAYPQTRRRLEAHHIPLILVDVSELAKAEGAVTCCSLVVRE